MSKSTRDSLNLERKGEPVFNASQTVTTAPDGAAQVFLDEEMVGVANDTLGFPDLKLCQGVVCAMNDGTMIGAHFSSEKSEVNVLNLMVNEIQKHGGPAAISQVVVGYDPNKKPASMLGASGKAAALGFQGNVEFVNTGAMKQDPGEGVFMQVRHGEGGGLEVSCARNASMKYDVGRMQNGKVGKTGAAPQPGQSLQQPAIESVAPAPLKVGQRFQPSLHSPGGGGLSV
ncbi:MAG: hypothetical protein J0L73_23590 [Verrucomicrobia bacterium]|nr:hypothetical protein [Verrucomicrobiota bacterium]